MKLGFIKINIKIHITDAKDTKETFLIIYLSDYYCNQYKSCLNKIKLYNLTHGFIFL